MPQRDGPRHRWLRRLRAAAARPPRDRHLRYVLSDRTAPSGEPGWSVASAPNGGAVDEQDRLVLRLLGGLPKGGAARCLTGRLGAVALEQMLLAGRLSLDQDPEKPLCRGAPLETALVWTEAAGGRQRIRCEGAPALALIPVTPPWYLDAARGRCGPLVTGLPPALAAALVAAPELTRAAAHRVREELSVHSAPLPAPSVRIDLGVIAPVPCLRLTTERAPAGPAEERAWLHLDYAGLCTAPDPAECTALSRPGPHAVLELRRDREAELRIWSALAARGLEPIVREPTRIGFRLREGASWARLVREELPALRREGWWIAIAPDSRLRECAHEEHDGENRRAMPLDAPQRALYEDVRTRMKTRIRRALAQADGPRAQRLLREAVRQLQQVCCDPPRLRLAAARGVERSVKLEWLMARLPTLLAEGRGLLVIADPPATRRRIQARLAEADIAVLGPGARPERPQGAGAAVYLAGERTARAQGARLVDTLIQYSPRPIASAGDPADARTDGHPARRYELVTAGTIEERLPAWQTRNPAAARILWGDDPTGEPPVAVLYHALEALLQGPD